MTIAIDWEDHNTLRYDFVGAWTWHEFQRASKTAFTLIRAAPYRINVIFDMQRSTDVPVGALDAVRRMLATAPTNLGIIVVTHADEFAEYTFRMLSNFDDDLARRIVVAETIDLARHTLTDYNNYSVAI